MAYDASMIEQLSVDGEVYALPYDAEPMVLFYNKAMFAEAGVTTPTVDWTTVDFLAAARATTGDGVYGFAIGQGIGGVGVWMAANGETYVEEDGTADLTDPDLVNRFQWVVDLATKEGVAAPLEASGGNFPDIDAFSSGQAAMLINGTWDLKHQQEEIGAENLGVATIPSDDEQSFGQVAGTGFAVTQTCQREAAFDAIAAMTSPAVAGVGRWAVPRPGPRNGGGWTPGLCRRERPRYRLAENGRCVARGDQNAKISTSFTQYAVEALSGTEVEDVLRQVADGVGEWSASGLGRRSQPQRRWVAGRRRALGVGRPGRLARWPGLLGLLLFVVCLMIGSLGSWGSFLTGRHQRDAWFPPGLNHPAGARPAFLTARARHDGVRRGLHAVEHGSFLAMALWLQSKPEGTTALRGV